MAASVWKGSISFGLLSIPIRLFPAARPERIKLAGCMAHARRLEHHFHPRFYFCVVIAQHHAIVSDRAPPEKMAYIISFDNIKFY